MPKRPKSRTIFDSAEIASPCSQNWNEMFGNDEVRFCHHCAKNVHNLSAMTRKQAKKLVAGSNGNLCVRYIRQPDGRIQTVEQKFYQIAGRASRLVTSVFTASLTLASAVYAQGGIGNSSGTRTDFGDDAPVVHKTNVEKLKSETRQDNKNRAKTADDAKSKISGTVSDPNGAVIPNVTVTLVNTQTNEQQSVVTNEESLYQFINVAAANYQISFAGTNGFASKTLENIAVGASGETIQNVTLEPGDYAIMGDIAIAISYRNTLIAATSENNLEEVKKLLREGADANATEESNGITALHAAVENGNLEIVRELLQAGAKANARDENRRTPLMSLDADATPELVRLLLSFGARVISRDNGKSSVLINAVRNYADAEVLQLLIQAGAKIDMADADGMTPLMEAAMDENLEAVKVLLGAGANVNLKTVEGETALSFASSEEIRQLLLSYGAQESKDEG